jgi:hypothetical protein
VENAASKVAFADRIDRTKDLQAIDLALCKDNP